MNLSDAESTSIHEALGYWVENWDWECPTLFGLDRSELEEVVRTWPASLEGHPEIAEVAVIGSLRELLWGASSLPPDRVERLLGMGHRQAESLLKRLIGSRHEKQRNA